MADRSHALRSVMQATGTSQRELSRLSGVHQPSISGYLSGRVAFSNELLARLLECMGYRLEVIRSAAPAELTRSERRSWLLHRTLAARLTRETLPEWRPTIVKNLERLRAGVRGQPHERNVQRWKDLVASADRPGLLRAMTRLDRDAIEMREVSPMSGLMTDAERLGIVRSVA